MLERAQQLNPGVQFRQGDMMALNEPDETWAGIASFYSIVHIPRGDMVRALTGSGEFYDQADCSCWPSTLATRSFIWMKGGVSPSPLTFSFSILPRWKAGSASLDSRLRR
jgi:hypothetical protein